VAVGAGSSISVSGTLVSSSAGGSYTEGFHIYNGNAVAVGGASIQLGGAVFDDDTDAGGVLYGLAVDGTSSIEIGSAGGAAPGAITVDAGSTISIDSKASVFFESPVIEDGALLVTRGTLTLESGVSGSGLLQVGTNATLSVQGNVTGSAVVQIGAGATLQLAGNVASTDLIDFNGSSAILSIGVGDVVGATITGFGLGDSIIVGSPITSADYMAGTGSNPGSLLLMNGTAAVGSLSLSGDFTDDTFFVSPTTTGGGDILLIAACYLEGTRIETEHGLVKIELIEPGDMIRVRGGRLLPAQWLGYRHIDCRRHPRPSQVWPVRVKAGAFGPAQPARDVWLSPDHAVFLDGVLIPIRYLINGATIVQEAAEEVTYWHIELESHEIISADGLMAESFLDTSNRAAFSNGGAMTDLHPDFAFRTWNERAAAPLAVGGAEVEAARSYLLDRALDLGHQLTTQPRLRLFADDIEIGAVRYVFGNMFLAPREARLLRLSTRSAVPAHVFDDSQDYRRLGVAISHIRLDGQHIDLCDPRLGRGWHQPETSNGWRWTDGDAEIALGTGGLLEIEIARVVRYWLPPVPVGAQTEQHECGVSPLPSMRAGACPTSAPARRHGPMRAER
jgi:hypothetical protein